MSTDDATKVGQGELNAQGHGTLAIWCAIATQPGNVAAGTEEACGGDQVCGEILHANGHVPGNEDGVASDAKGRADDEDQEACFISVRTVGADSVNYGTPKVD